MGFVQPKDKPVTRLDEKVEQTAVQAARRKFSPEFMNRLDQVVVFHPLKSEELDEILDMELGQVQKCLLNSTAARFFFRVTSKGREFLLEEGTDQRYGARHLKRAIESYLVCPMAKLLATAQIETGDMLVVDRHPVKKGLVFFKDKDEEMRRRFAPSVPQASNHFASTLMAA